MKKLLPVLFTFTCLPNVAMTFAAHPDTGPGCGLGKLAWGDYPNQQAISAQIFMSTTNLTFGTQSFGISSGTSGCTNDGLIAQNEKMNAFATFNFDDIAQEMAQGHGEHLTSLAALMDIPSDQHEIFFAIAQEKYTTLITEGEASPTAVIKSIYRAMGNYPILVQTATSK